MAKALAVLRTAYLVFIIGYTVRAMPLLTSVARTFDEQYALCSSSLHVLIRAVWLAIAWIALETVLGWVGVSWRGRGATRTPAPHPAQPPGASSNPPPRP